MSGTKIQIHQRTRVLSQDDILAIHQASLKVLKETGVVFKHKRALEILVRAGSEVSGQVVRFPEDLVKKFIKMVQYQITLPARNPQKDIHLGVGNVHYTNGYGAPYVRDRETGQIRGAALEDLAQFTRLSDYLDNVHYVLTQVTVQDLPPEVVDVFQVVALLKNTEKHVGLSISDATYIDEIIQIGRLASGLGKNDNCRQACFSLGAVSLSPLTYSQDGCHRLIRMAQQGVIIRISSLPVAGATSPVTTAGTLVQAHAEVLAGICLVQAINPGNLIIYGFLGAPMDMVSGKQLSASPEAVLMNAAMSQICEYCQLPFGYGSGGLSNSSAFDEQNGFEKDNTILFAALAGVDVIHHAAGGLQGAGMVASFEDMIIANEVCRIVNRELRGIKVAEDTLAVDVIREVGPEGHFLNTAHTAAHFKHELFISNLLDRRTHEERLEGEHSLMLTKAKKMAMEVIETHCVPVFDAKTTDTIECILEEVVNKSGVSIPARKCVKRL